MHLFTNQLSCGYCVYGNVVFHDSALGVLCVCVVSSGTPWFPCPLTLAWLVGFLTATRCTLWFETTARRRRSCWTSSTALCSGYPVSHHILCDRAKITSALQDIPIEICAFIFSFFFFPDGSRLWPLDSYGESRGVWACREQHSWRWPCQAAVAQESQLRGLFLWLYTSVSAE